MNRYHEGKYRPNYPKPEREKKHLRKNIAHIKPDILALQEMGSHGHLLELQNDLQKEGYPMKYKFISEDFGRDRNLAFLSKIPILSSKAHEEILVKNGYGRQQVLRGLLEIEISYRNKPLKIFNLHLKSRRTTNQSDPNGSQYRHKESRAILEIIAERTNQGRIPCIVLGDFNDYQQSPTISLFKKNKTPKLYLLPCFDRKGETWTHYYKKGDTYSTLDYIFYSEQILIKENQGSIFYDRQYFRASDHRPVFLDLIDN